MAGMRSHKPLLGVFAAAVVMMFTMSGMAQAAETSRFHWLDKITDQVLNVQFNESNPDHGKMGPYLQQLATARTALLRGNGSDVYRGMNRFMDMLQARENGISVKTSNELFDYCYEVTPASFHDVGRHRAKFKADTARYWEDFLQDVGGGTAAANQLQ